jgi:hypothetical protein
MTVTLTQPTPPDLPAKSKTLATWIALAGGSFGLHRFYLYGPRDWPAWLHPLPTLVGLVGAVRMHNLGQDDILAWLLVPLLGMMISVGMVSAIAIGLTSDERWAQRFGGDCEGAEAFRRTAWGPIFGVILALFLGGAVLMGTIAFSGQKYFEWQALGANSAA